jgi:alpha-beta hydrolase superfamily lysophospholipase
VVTTLILMEYVRVRRMPELHPWQSREPDGEFEARQDLDFAQYLELESSLFKRLDEYMVDPAELDGLSRAIRYVRGGMSDPATFEPNWNRSIELHPDVAPPVGGVLLLHGLTDSPYSMRSMAEQFRARGFYALCMRLPGHGTVPAGLLHVTVEDWMAAVRIGWQHVTAQVGGDRPVVLCGYSNGGALATLFTLELVDRTPPAPAAAAQRVPDLVCLFSPAIGITPFAAASNWHRAYSWLPGLENVKWLAIEPEFDPFKYNSFPKNGGAQSWRLTRLIEAAMNRAVASGRSADMPPFLTFQSVVDSTIVARDVITRLHDRLPDNGSELVVFDLNHASILDGFFAQPHPPLERLLQDGGRSYAVTIVGNESPESGAVVARHRAPRSVEVAVTPLEASWPEQVYSLAHVSIPFPEDDPIYGAAGVLAGPERLRIGALALRGERNVLTISAADLLRLRHNPFHAFMMGRMAQAVERVMAPPSFSATEASQPPPAP